MKKKIITRLISVLIIVCMIVLDQLSKAWMVANLKGTNGMPFIKGLIGFIYAENTGAAFSVLSGRQIFLIIFTGIILLAVIVKALETPLTKRFAPLHIAFFFLIAGAIGNMIDRIKQGYVVDFLNFEFIEFPIFNVADCYVTISEIMLVILLLFVYKHEETAYIFSLKGREQ